MWLPTPIYERAPQFWFLLGLLFVATGFYMGSDFALSYWYIGVGFACCAYGAGVLIIRIRHRQDPQVAEQAAAEENPVRAESSHPDMSNTD